MTDHDLLFVGKILFCARSTITVLCLAHLAWDYFFPGKVDQHRQDQIPENK